LHPVFLLHIRLPKQEIDHGLEPLKSSVLFKVRPVSSSSPHGIGAHSMVPVGRGLGTKGSQKRSEECLKICGILHYREHGAAVSTSLRVCLIFC
jgi:hypothetical protein